MIILYKHIFILLILTICHIEVLTRASPVSKSCTNAQQGAALHTKLGSICQEFSSAKRSISTGQSKKVTLWQGEKRPKETYLQHCLVQFVQRINHSHVPPLALGQWPNHLAGISLSRQLQWSQKLLVPIFKRCISPNQTVTRFFHLTLVLIQRISIFRLNRLNNSNGNLVRLSQLPNTALRPRSPGDT